MHFKLLFHDRLLDLLEKFDEFDGGVEQEGHVLDVLLPAHLEQGLALSECQFESLPEAHHLVGFQVEQGLFYKEGGVLHVVVFLSLPKLQFKSVDLELEVDEVRKHAPDVVVLWQFVDQQIE